MRRAARPREAAPCAPVTLPPCVPSRVCSVWLAIDTGSPANERGSSRWRGARDARVRGRVCSLVAPVLLAHRVRPPCVVVLVRVSPRPLDSDNAASSLKRVRDGVADALGIDDADPRVSWVVEQRRGPAKVRGVVVEVYPRGEAARALGEASAQWLEDNAAALDVVLPVLRGNSR